MEPAVALKRLRETMRELDSLRHDMRDATSTDKVGTHQVVVKGCNDVS